VATRRIDVGVDSGILHIGSAIYPLRGITSVQTVKSVPYRWRYARSFIIWAVVWLALGFVVVAVIDHQAAGQQNLSSVVWTVVVGILAIRLVVLLVRLARRTYYILLIGTAGTSQALVSSPRLGEIDELRFKIASALQQPDNPVLNFHQTVIDHGHKITQTGSGNKVNIG
jgi:hypothetical protein